MVGISKAEDEIWASKLNIQSYFGLDKEKNIEIYYWEPTASDMQVAHCVLDF